MTPIDLLELINLGILNSELAVIRNFNKRILQLQVNESPISIESVVNQLHHLIALFKISSSNR